MAISRVSVIGAGTMGAGIAQVCANAGLAVQLVDVKEELARKGLATISALQVAQYGADYRTSDRVAVDYVALARAVGSRPARAT